MRQLKMAVTPTIESLARLGAVQTIVDLDHRFHGVVRDASRALAANGHRALPAKTRRRRISAEGRRRISEAQTARWARQRAGKKRA